MLKQDIFRFYECVVLLKCKYFYILIHYKGNAQNEKKTLIVIYFMSRFCTTIIYLFVYLFKLNF